MGAHLAAVLGTDLTLWDGTPLSLIQPSSLIAEKYRQATDPEKNALRALKLCASCGLAFVPRPLLIEVSKLQGFGVHPDVIVEEPIIQSLYEKGFLMRASDWIQVYPPYLQMITDWQVSPQMREAVQVTLNDRRWSKQLVAFGAFCARTDDLQRAQSIYEAAVRLDPSNAAYYYRLGVVLSRLRLWSGAAASLQRATDISPRWPAAWYRLAHALMEQGRTHEGREAFERGRSVGSKDPRVRYQTGELLRIEGRTEDAIEEFLEAIRMDPQDAAVWHAYGQALRQQSRWSEAAKAHRRAVELRPDWAKAYFGLGEPLKELGDVDGAEQAYRKAIDLRPDIGEVYTYMSKLLEKNGRIEEAERALREGLQHCPNEARIHSYLGQVLSNMHRNNEALEEFRIALELKPSYVEAHVGLSTQQRFLRGSDPQLLEEAIRNNKRAIEIDPDCASAHYGLGMCYLNKKMCDAAVQSFREALRCDPEMGMVWYRLAIALRCADASEEEALDCLKRAERLGYDTNKVKLESARLFVQKGWTGDALRLLGELAQANGGMLPEVVAKDGAFQSIREDPYFVALLHKL